MFHLFTSKHLSLGCFLLIIFFSFPLAAQKVASKVEKFGKVSKETLEMTEYAPDKEAEAVVLFDVGNIFMEYSESKGGFSLRTERHRRIKILKQGGTDQANIEIRYFVPENRAADESVSGLKAYTYNLENGKIVESKVEKDAIFKENENENWKKIKFAFSNVKAGSVIEYKYTLNSDFIFDIDWLFQDQIPTAWSEVTVAHAEYYTYRPHFTGFEALVINEKTSRGNFIIFTDKERRSSGWFIPSKISSEKMDYQDIIYHWAVQDAPAFKGEKYITTARDYLTKVDLELSSKQFPNSPPKYYTQSWEDVAKTLFDVERFGAELNRKGDVKDIAQTAMAKSADKMQQLAALYAVVRNLKWNGKYSLFASKNVKQVLADKEGNSADLNLLLISLCNAADITASPVVLSTRNHGKLRTYSPSLDMLNHVIVAIDLDENNKFLIDASDKNTPIGVLPFNCLNGSGVLLKSKEQVQMIDLSPSKATKSTCMATMQLSPEGTLTGDLNYRYTDYASVTMREEYFDEKEEKAFFSKHIAAEKKNYIINSFEAKEAKDVNKPFSFKINLTTEDKRSGGMIYLEPFFSKVFETNPFTQENRKYPVDFGFSAQENYIFSLTIPVGYKVEELPKNEKISLPDNAGSFTLMASAQDNKIQLSCNYVRTKKLFIGEEYALLKDFVGRIIAKQREQIVLKKL